MTKGWLLALVVAFGLVGCAGLRQFPQVTTDHDATLRELDLDYAKTIDLIYGKDDTPKAVGDGTQARLLRNRMMERRMAVIDAYFKEFQAGLVKENVRADFLIALVGVGVGGAGALVSETASQILSAVSGGLAGGQAAYSKAVLYDKAMSALIAQMQASRKVIAGQIFQRWALDIDKYPMWMARTDLDAYYFAGSLPGAILSTAADAGVKERQAENELDKIRTSTFSADQSGDALQKFWMPQWVSGTDDPEKLRVDASRQKLLERWLEDNGLPQVSIQLFIRGAHFAELRKKAVSDLKIPLE